MNGKLKDISHYGPSLCVKFHDLHSNYVFVAVGPFIQVYDYETAQLINKVRVFSCNKVHGFNFSKDGKKCIIYGSKSVSMILVDELLESDDVSSKEKVYLEWIIYGTFNFSDDHYYLLTCYNLVIVADLEGNVIAKKNLPNERSILYSGTIKVLSDDKVLVNAGTVMGGVLIWDLLKEEKLYNLTGHEGSIFYVVVSDNGRFAASCSDDRSIRLWDLNNGKELSVGWGHTARIWNLKFFENDTKLISVSEDCTCRIWDVVEDNKTNETSLVMRNIYETHLIKNVWGVDVKEDLSIAVTTGNDGRIKLIDLKQSSRNGNELESFNINKIAQQFNIPINKGESFKGFHWFNFGLVAITSIGKVLKYDEKTGDWILIVIDYRLVSYSLTNGVTDESGENNVVIFSNNKSDLLLMNFTKDGEMKDQYRSLHFNDLAKTYNAMSIPFKSKYCLLVLESPNPRDKMLVLQIEISTLDIVKKYMFKKPENFISSCLETHNDYLLMGSRFSTVAIYDLNNQDKDAYIIRKISPGDTTTSIKYIESKDNYDLFSVTNRDGFYNFIKVNLSELSAHKLSHEIIHSNKIIKGFLEGAFYNNANEYITYGFKSSLFYMFNETNGYETISQVCGGAHRQWKLCKLNEKNNGHILVYIQASELHLRRMYNAFVPETVENGIHGREIRDISILPNAIDNKYEPKNGHLFVTGSEDTSIKLCKFDPIDGKVVNYWTERKHVSGLQRLKFINNDLMISCSAREELFLWKLNVEFESNPYINIRQILPTLSTHPDLRIMDFDVVFQNNDNNSFIVSTVYSDSSIKVWYYNNSKNEFKEIWTTKYQTCCIFNTDFVTFEDELYIVIAPTDGFLVLYNLSMDLPFLSIKSDKFDIDNNNMELVKSETQPELRLQVHKSGIKTMTISKSSNDFKIFTGGDDNAVGVSKFTKINGTITGEVTYMNEKAASSTVTSCNLMENDTKLLTTSVDQRVLVWDIIEDKIVLKESKYTTIADTGSSDVVKCEDSTSILIGGVGLSVWDY